MLVKIAGPNLRDQSKGQFHVHASGCGDLVRGCRSEPEYTRADELDIVAWQAVVGFIYGDIVDEHVAEGEDQEQVLSDLLGDIHFFPCCKELLHA